jgi:hypothetical protein
VEFGLLKEKGELKAYGAGLLSSFGEMGHAIMNEGEDAPARLPWDPKVASTAAYPITSYQPTYVFCYVSLPFFPSVDASVSLSRSITTRLSAFSDTTWHESNHKPSLNQSSIDTHSHHSLLPYRYYVAESLADAKHKLRTYCSIFFLSFLVCDVSLSLSLSLSIYYPLSALSDMT